MSAAEIDALVMNTARQKIAKYRIQMHNFRQNNNHSSGEFAIFKMRDNTDPFTVTFHSLFHFCAAVTMKKCSLCIIQMVAFWLDSPYEEYPK